MKRIILLCLAALLLSGSCGLIYAAAEAKWPKGSSAGQQSNGKLTVDATNISEGYFMAAVSASTDHRMKMRVVKDGETLTYDLNSEGKFEVFPLQLGSGKYDISLYENVSGKKFSNAGKISIEVNLTREDGAFLYPNQYVYYTEESLRSVSSAICELANTEGLTGHAASVTVRTGDVKGGEDLLPPNEARVPREWRLNK